MTSFLLKIIGIFTMLCDHTGDAILGNFSFLNIIGRIAFPIFAFQLTQSYIHTKDLKKFIFRLFVFSIVSQMPYMLFLSTFVENIYFLNIGFTMLFSIFAILSFDKINNKFVGLCVSLLIAIIGQIINVDYGAFGILITLIFYIFRKNKLLMNICALISIASFYFIKFVHSPYLSITEYYLPLTLFTCLSLIFINLYNGKQGPKVKYLFYVFYPLHLLILYLL